MCVDPKCTIPVPHDELPVTRADSVSFRHDGYRGWVVVNGHDLSDVIAKDGVDLKIVDGLPRVVLTLRRGVEVDVVCDLAEIRVSDGATR